MPLKSDRRPRLDAERAEVLGLEALAFLAGDPARLGRFLALTGADPAELKAAAGEPRTLLAVLEFLLADESLLLVFAAEAGIDPAGAGAARDLLARAAGEGAT
jgi:hypothetical protein